VLRGRCAVLRFFLHLSSTLRHSWSPRRRRNHSAQPCIAEWRAWTWSLFPGSSTRGSRGRCTLQISGLWNRRTYPIQTCVSNREGYTHHQLWQTPGQPTRKIIRKNAAPSVGLDWQRAHLRALVLCLRGRSSQAEIALAAISAALGRSGRIARRRRIRILAYMHNGVSKPTGMGMPFMRARLGAGTDLLGSFGRHSEVHSPSQIS
jgi:hypothetical protein